MLLQRILPSTWKIYVKRKRIPRDSLPFFHDRFVFNGRGALRILSRCPAPDAITLLPEHENSSFPLSFIIVEKLRAAYFHDHMEKEGKRKGKLLYLVFIRVFIRARVKRPIARDNRFWRINDVVYHLFLTVEGGKSKRRKDK